MGSKPSSEKGSNVQAGDGLRSLRTTSVFKAVNFELYVKPVSLSLHLKAVYCNVSVL